MSTNPPLPGTPRPAAAVNKDIRQLMLRTGGRLRPEDRPVYHQLVEEWHLATARERGLGEIATAA